MSGRSSGAPLALGALAALLAAGCGSTPNRPIARSPAADPAPASAAARDASGSPVEPEDQVPAQPPAGAGAVVARVAGEPVTAAELLSVWLHRDSPAVRASLEELVLSRLVLAEARRLGVEVEPADVDAAYAEVRRRLEERVAEGGSGLDPERFVRERLGLDPARYFERLRGEARLDLLAERVVRAWLLSTERTEVRVIVVARRDDADVVQAALARGDDFATLADRHNAQGAAGKGGRIPPVVRGDAALARLAFSTPVGETGGPVSEGGQWLFLEVDARPEPLEGDWSEIGPAVLASLRERSIEDPEYWQWKSTMVERYEVDMGPFLDLMGGSLAQ